MPRVGIHFLVPISARCAPEERSPTLKQAYLLLSKSITPFERLESSKSSAVVWIVIKVGAPDWPFFISSSFFFFPFFKVMPLCLHFPLFRSSVYQSTHKEPNKLPRAVCTVTFCLLPTIPILNTHIHELVNNLRWKSNGGLKDSASQESRSKGY